MKNTQNKEINYRHLENKLNADSIRKIRDMLNSNSLGQHKDYLLSKFGKDSIQLKQIIQYGIDNLPDNNYRPNFELGTYFFVVSEIHNLQDFIRDLMMDAMIYCKNDSDTGVGNLNTLREKYKKAASML